VSHHARSTGFSLAVPRPACRNLPRAIFPGILPDSCNQSAERKKAAP
jgi:hypothetical protein